MFLSLGLFYFIIFRSFLQHFGFIFLGVHYLFFLFQLHFAGFSTPTPIQAQTWPIALQSKDIVAIAKTGSGKTLGYLIPAFVHLRRLRNNPQNGPTVLVLAPTRELATQIQDEAMKFGRSSRVTCTVCLCCLIGLVSLLLPFYRNKDIVLSYFSVLVWWCLQRCSVKGAR